MTRVSIITPVFNGAATLGETLLSVLAQEEPSWEYFVVDDGSTDATGDIVRQCGDRRVKYLRRPRQGRSAARNAGIDAAQGDALIFLDADDWLLPNALSAHLDNLSRSPNCGVSVSDGEFWGEDRRAIARFSERRAPVTSAHVLPRIITDAGLVGAPLAAAIRRTVVERHTLRFDVNQTIGEDWLFWIDAAQHTDFAFTPALTCRYRWHLANTTLGSNRAFRQQELWRLRQTVMARPFFSRLEAADRREFFFQVLGDVLSGLPHEQDRLFDMPAFRSLPQDVQAELIDFAAIESLLENDSEQTRVWFQRARTLSPATGKIRVLTALFVTSPALTRLALRLWRGRRRPESSLEPTLRPETGAN